MGIVTAIFDAIAALPALLGYLKSFIGWISDQVSAAEKRKLAADMAKATSDAKQTKDTSGMDQMFDPNKKK